MSSKRNKSTATPAAAVPAVVINAIANPQQKRRYMPLHATEMPQMGASDYFDLDHLSDENAAFYVSMGAVGEPEVGKTTLLIRFANRYFERQRKQTIAYDRTEHWIKSNHPHYNRKTQVTLFDTAGQERYRAFGTSILREVEGVMLVFDATKRETFDRCREWRTLIKQHNNWCVCMLIANKMDLYRDKQHCFQWLATPEMSADERKEILDNDGVDLAQAAKDLQCDGGAYAIDCVSGENVDDAFVDLVDLAIANQISLSKEADEQSLDKGRDNNTSSGGGGGWLRKRNNEKKLDLRGGGGPGGKHTLQINNNTKITCC
jgi:small GTP-binding protein